MHIDNLSIVAYLRTVYIRLRDKIKIDNDEYENTYKYYKEFCIAEGLLASRFHSFYDELKKVGIESFQYKYPDGTRKRRRNFTLLLLEKLLSSKEPLVRKEIVRFELDGEVFLLALKLTKVSGKVQVSTDTAPEEVVPATNSETNV